MNQQLPRGLIFVLGLEGERKEEDDEEEEEEEGAGGDRKGFPELLVELELEIP